MESSRKIWGCGILFFPHSMNMESLKVLYAMSAHCKLYSFLFICNWECRVPVTCYYFFFITSYSKKCKANHRTLKENWKPCPVLTFFSQEPPTMGSRPQPERPRLSWQAPVPSNRSLQKSMTHYSVSWLFQNKCFKVSGEGPTHVIFGINDR